MPTVTDVELPDLAVEEDGGIEIVFLEPEAEQ